MSEDPAASQGAGGPTALPRIRLVRRDDATLVEPLLAGAGADGCEPFRLAKLARSLANDLALFGELVWQQHRRCVGVLLLLDRRSHEWTYRVPAQRCGKGAACWSALRQDVSQVAEDHLLAGSYQTRLLAQGEESADAPPPHDGVHFVHVIEPAPTAVWSCLRGEGHTHAVPADDVIYDDVQAALEECLPRLRLTP